MDRFNARNIGKRTPVLCEENATQELEVNTRIRESNYRG